MYENVPILKGFSTKLQNYISYLSQVVFSHKDNFACQDPHSVFWSTTLVINRNFVCKKIALGTFNLLAITGMDVITAS